MVVVSLAGVAKEGDIEWKTPVTKMRSKKERERESEEERRVNAQCGF